MAQKKRIMHDREGGSAPKTGPAYKASMHPEVLDATGAAKVLGVSRSLTLRLARKGKIPGKKIGKEWRFRLSTLLQWLGKVEAPPPDWLEALLKSGKAKLAPPGTTGQRNR